MAIQPLPIRPQKAIVFELLVRPYGEVCVMGRNELGEDAKGALHPLQGSQGKKIG